MYIVILAGGSGTRFWPLSREAAPKQLLTLTGKKTMIQQTVTRFGPSLPIKKIYVITNKKYAFDIDRQLSDVIAKGSYTIIIEPYARNTAPAIGLAAIQIKQHDHNGVMAVMPSDHIIQKTDLFCDILLRAKAIAEKGYLTTLGIVPTKPSTGYGYIKKGGVLDPSLEAYKVECFVEKPDYKRAQEFVSTDNYLWNSGIFIWKVSEILDAIKTFMPDLYNGLMEIQNAIGSETEGDVVRTVFAQLESVSVDYGIMERTDNIALIPADIDWCDVGSWTALEEIFPKDNHGNIKFGNVVDIDSKNSIIYAGKRVMAVVGLEDIVVVDTPDATLVAAKKRVQDVNQVVDVLKKAGAEEFHTHVTVERPWGTYTVLEEGERYKIKRLVVYPGKRLSLQMHLHRTEHWIVVSGTAKITIGGKTHYLHNNESTYVPLSTTHRIENPGKLPLHIIEVQNGEYVKEDDIIRFDDDFGRDKEVF